MTNVSSIELQREVETMATLVATNLRELADSSIAKGLARPELSGRLIRPIVALEGWRSISAAAPPREFWYGAMAVQLAHEASLLHDDVVDQSKVRRGAPTVAATMGTAAALILGDHVLTTAYRYAARTRNLEFIELFAESVERTVAGELAQAHAMGRILDFDEYASIVHGKSGALLGCALSLGPSLAVSGRARRFHEIGCRIGLVYQMLDDLLDLSPLTETGKPSLSDYAQRHWTWPLEQMQIDDFTRDTDSLLCAMNDDASAGMTAARRCLARYDEEVHGVASEIRDELSDAPALEALLDQWRERALNAVELQESALRREAVNS